MYYKNTYGIGLNFWTTKGVLSITFHGSKYFKIHHIFIVPSKNATSFTAWWSVVNTIILLWWTTSSHTKIIHKRNSSANFHAFHISDTLKCLIRMMLKFSISPMHRLYIIFRQTTEINESSLDNLSIIQCWLCEKIQFSIFLALYMWCYLHIRSP